jgi:putative flippase GtrA
MTAQPEKPSPVVEPSAHGPARRAASALGEMALRVSPAPLRRWLQTEAGKRFARFVPVAIAAVIASQITLAILTGLNMTAGKAALCASIMGAFVSYLLSRWAWESRGRPDLLRETVPFWTVSLAVWGILSLVTHYANGWAKAHDLHHLEKHLVVQGSYLAANCITFVCRFLIFHYVLFNKRRRAAPVAAVVPAGAAGNGEDVPPMALTGDAKGQQPPEA